MVTLLDLAKKYPTMRRILWRNRRRDLKKEWYGSR